MSPEEYRRQQDIEEEKQQESSKKSFAFDSHQPSGKPREENLQKPSQSNRPPDAEFLRSLQELGVDETAKKYGRQRSTIINVWVRRVEGARDVLRKLSPEKRGTFRNKKKGLGT